MAVIVPVIICVVNMKTKSMCQNEWHVKQMGR